MLYCTGGHVNVLSDYKKNGPSHILKKIHTQRHHRDILNKCCQNHMPLVLLIVSQTRLYTINSCSFCKIFTRLSVFWEYRHQNTCASSKPIHTATPHCQRCGISNCPTLLAEYNYFLQMKSLKSATKFHILGTTHVWNIS